MRQPAPARQSRVADVVEHFDDARRALRRRWRQERRGQCQPGQKEQRTAVRIGIHLIFNGIRRNAGLQVIEWWHRRWGVAAISASHKAGQRALAAYLSTSSS